MSQSPEEPVDYQTFVEICIALDISDPLYIELSYPVYVARKSGNFKEAEKAISTRKMNLYLRQIGRLN